MNATKTWTDARCRIASKTLFDILKVEVGAAYASNFFAAFTTHLKLVLIAVMILTAIFAFLLYPKEEES